MNASARLAITRGALLLMETLWVYALVAFLVAMISGGDRPSLLGAAAVVFTSFAISRFLQQSDLPLNLVRLWGVLISVLIFYVIIRIDFFGDWRLWDFTWADAVVNDTHDALQNQAQAIVGIPLLWLVWLRGILRGQQHIDFESVASSFAIGVVIVAFVEVFAGAVDAPGGVGAIAVPYVAVGLLAIGTTQAARGDESGGRFTTTWFGVMIAFVLVMALVGLLFALSDLSAVSNAMGYVARPLSQLIGQAFYYILWPVFTVMEFVMRIIAGIFRSGFGSAAHKELIPDQPSPTPTPENNVTHDLPGWFAWVLRIGLGVPIVVALLAGTALLFTKFRKREEEDEVKESTYQDGRLGQDLSGMLSSFLGGLRRHPNVAADLDPARRLYFDVVQAGVGKDVIRDPNETPQELAPRLDGAFSSKTPSRITTLFQDVRYGGAEPPAADVEALRKDWDALKE